MNALRGPKQQQHWCKGHLAHPLHLLVFAVEVLLKLGQLLQVPSLLAQSLPRVPELPARRGSSSAGPEARAPGAQHRRSSTLHHHNRPRTHTSVECVGAYPLSRPRSRSLSPYEPLISKPDALLLRALSDVCALFKSETRVLERTYRI